MTDYVAGFLFSEDRKRVALIQKARPAWQAGSWNALGGHIEPTDVGPRAAMEREFLEETGVEFGAWQNYCDLYIPGKAIVRFYRGFASNHTMSLLRTTTDEPVGIWELSALPGNTICNIRWLIEMALSMDCESASAFTVTERS